VLQDNFEEFMPMGMQAKMMICFCLAVMFYISWTCLVVLLGVLALFGLVDIIHRIRYNVFMRRHREHRKELFEFEREKTHQI